MDSTGLQALIDTRKDLERYANQTISWKFASMRKRLQSYLHDFEDSFNEKNLSFKTIDEAIGAPNHTSIGSPQKKYMKKIVPRESAKNESKVEVIEEKDIIEDIGEIGEEL